MPYVSTCDLNATKDMILRVLSETNQKLDLLLVLSYLGHNMTSIEEGRMVVPNDVMELLTTYLRLTNEAAQTSNRPPLKAIIGTSGLRIKMKKFLRFCLKRGDKFPTRIEDGFDTTASPKLRAICHYTKEFQMLVSRRLTQTVKDLESGRPAKAEDEIDELLDYELQIMSRLEQELQSLQDERNEKVLDKTKTIEKFESEIQCIETKNTTEIEDAKASRDQEISVMTSKCDNQVSSLQIEAGQLRKRLADLMRENNIKENQLKAEKLALQNEVNALNEIYNQMMNQKEDICFALSSDIETLFKEKTRMEEQATKLKRQHDVIVTERERLRLENERVMKETVEKARAVTMIQARWRGYVTRLKLRAKLKKSRKAKKGAKQAKNEAKAGKKPPK